MEEKLQKAAMEGDTASLTLLIEQDPLILERRSAISTHRLETPLHIASMLGHVAFAAELLKRKPALASELDATRCTALHLAAAAAAGVEIVGALLRADPDTCTFCDRDGRNPVHVAAMNGRIGALKEMVKLAGCGAARAAMRRGGTVDHLCVEYSQLEALEFLVENGECLDLINVGDGYGNTALHLAVAHKQVEITECLFSSRNRHGSTELKRNDSNGYFKKEKPTQKEESLSRAGAGTAQNHQNPNQKLKKKKRNEVGGGGDGWLDRKRSGLMIVASLIATMAFQFTVTPPPSVWTDPAPFPAAVPGYACLVLCGLRLFDF